MDGFLANVVKYLLFATNFAIFIIGCVVLGIGIYALVDGKDLVDIVNNSGADVTIEIYTSAAIILIVVSVFVVILTFFGCCGAIKESKCMLGTYFVMILVMFVVMIVGAVIGYSQSMDEVTKALKESMKKFKDNPDVNDIKKDEKAITDAWNTVQREFSCCGVELYNNGSTYNSWEVDCPEYPTSEDFKVPLSCCDQLEGTEGASVSECRKDPTNIKYKLTGCVNKLNDVFESNKDNILIVGIVIVVIMFLNMLFAFAMCTMAN